MISIQPQLHYDFAVIHRLGIAEDKRHILQRCISASAQTWVGYVCGEPACMWGLIPPTLLSETAYLWLIVTPLVDEHQFVFVRHSQIEIKKMLEQYRNIVGHCDKRHHRSVRWLKWLGARFDTEGPMASFTIVRE